MSKPKETERKQVGIWVRVSTEDQVRGESPEHHERRARAYAESKDWRVREVYRLEAVSGKSVMGRPEAERMLAHISSGHVTGLIFSKLARLARNTRELLDFADIFREHGADLISLHEAIDTTTPAGRLFYTMIAAMAQWEREEIAERVAASVPIRAKLGKPLGGAAPFGYQWKDRQLVPDPKEAPVRQLLYELFAEHQRKKTVANILNERGYRTRKGAKFSDTTVTRLLQDPTAKGVRRANYTRSRGDGKQWDLKPETEWVLTPVEPIVSEELWDRCNAILEERRRDGKQPAKKTVHLFTGVVQCRCGRRMYVPSNTPKYICYGCRNKIPKDDLEAVFQEQLKAFFFSPKEVAAYLEQADEVVRSKAEALSELERERQRVAREMEKVYRLYVADQLSPEGFGRQYGPLEKRLHQLDEELPRLAGEVDFLKIQHLSRDEVLSGARDLYARWPALKFAEKRRVVESVVQIIIIGKKEVEIRLLYLPSASEMVADRQQNLTDSWTPPAAPVPGTPPTAARARSPRARPPAAAAATPGRRGGTPGARPGRALRDAPG
jgi:site-specific DNA recombinase